MSPLLPYDLAICGLAELPGEAGPPTSHVLSILDPGYPDPPALLGLPLHRTTLRFADVTRPTAFEQPPSERDAQAILELGEALASETVTRLLVHCHAGISRSTAAAAILMAQRRPGHEREAFAALARIRPFSWPNAALVHHADRLLSRGGALVAAMREYHSAVARREPRILPLLRTVGRGHEVHELDGGGA